MNKKELGTDAAAIADQQLAEGKTRTEVGSDWRHISQGRQIPSLHYADQPYIVKAQDGAWICVMTTGAGTEGQAGQHVVSLRSEDGGRTWGPPVPIEPPDGPEASWAVALVVPSGRVYAFYVHNTDNIRQLKADNPPYSSGYTQRMDSFGYYVFKYSDDDGRSWSEQRYTIPVRPFEIDRKNVYGGEIRFFWNVGKPFIHEGAAYVPLHKVGGLGDGWFTSSEGALLKSANLLTEADSEGANWQTLPDGDIGLRTPQGGGPVAEEQSFSVLSDGTFYCVYRTIDGYPACTYSYDGGHSWTEPRYQTYADGRRMKNPRAANFAWRCTNGKFLYWFHNHGGRQLGEHPQRRTLGYQDRNPVWLCGGVEVDTPTGRQIRWSQPEIVLYDDDPYVRMSYPDLIEDGGKVFISETQKFIARSHEMPKDLLEGMWNSFEAAAVAGDGLALEVEDAAGQEAAAPRLPLFNERDNASPTYGARDLRQGFSVELAFTLDSLEAGQLLVEGRRDDGKGWCLQTTGAAVEVVLNDGRTENRWACDDGLLQPGQRHHLVVVVDGGPKIISFIVDGRLCDGGAQRQYGWGRFSPQLREANGAETLRIGAGVDRLRVYGRALRTWEAVGNFRAGA